MKQFKFLTALWLVLFAGMAVAAGQSGALPTEKTVTAALADAQKMTDGDSKTALLATLNAQMDWLKQIQTQEQTNQTLQKTLDSADSETKKNNTELASLKKQLEQPLANFSKQDLDSLQNQLATLKADQQKSQEQLSAANVALSGQNTVSEKAQNVLTENAKRSQELRKLVADQSDNDQLAVYQLELRFLELENTYNQNLLKHADQLTLLYQSRYNLLSSKIELQRNQAAAVQDAINQKNLAESKNQVEQAVEQAQQQSATNEYIQEQLDKNAGLSQQLLKQTEKTNSLTQDELRMRGVQENLTQTKRTIDEQISALQGTLLLSRIIQQQKQNLPTDLNIKGLAKQIADLRVQIFDKTQERNALYNLDEVIANAEKEEEQTFSASEKKQLVALLTERRKMLSDLITALNSQLNLSINLELAQQQITEMSDQIQSQLDQQSFWVKSNEPMTLDWFVNAPRDLSDQFTGAMKKLAFNQNWDNLGILLGVAFLLALVGGLIFKFKKSIKKRLSEINTSINSLKKDSQWNTPIALFFTVLLALPSVLWFLAACQVIGFFFFRNPMEFWDWAFEMAVYWWFFAFLLAVLRPHGIMSHHFGFSQESVAKFRNLTRRIIVAVALQLNTSVFSAVAQNGLAGDVLGEVITMVTLVICLFIIAPMLNQTALSYADDAQKDGVMLRLVRFALYTVPMGLILLVVLGYYYTALTLIEHIIYSYIAWTLWVLVRNGIYRVITVASRRLSYRRLMEKRYRKLKDSGEKVSDDVVTINEQEELALNDVRNQLVSFADLFIWTALVGIFYWVWSDLLTVASYLQGIELWTQTSTTDAGTVTETITLFSVLVALLILVITYILIRNISGILEVLVFSKVKLSQGTPYAITTLVTYALIAIGGAWAFSTLGMSWSKLQWLFAALSVGLGFGMQEIFANFVSGLILLFERPIRVGDTITINGVSGTVSKIRIRAISIIDFDRKEVIMPNKSFVTGEVTNWALSNTVTRLIITVGVAYGSDLELVKRLLLQAAAEEPNVLKDPAPRALFLTFGASTLDHELRVYVNDVGIRTETIDLLNRRINALFAEHNVEIAFNQLDIFIKNKDNGEIMPLIDVTNLKQA